MVLMIPSPDSGKLACLNSNSSILVVDTGSFQTTHFFPNVFRRGESVASFCFSPDSTSLFVLGTRNGYFIADMDDPNDVLNEGHSIDHGDSNVCDGQTDATGSRKRRRRQSQRNVRSVRGTIQSI